MDKLKMHTPDITDANIEKILASFPDCRTETQDEKGNLVVGIDFDLLRQELSPDLIVEGQQERYQLNWPGKREALLTANAKIAKTLRPSREESVDFDTTKNLYIEGDNLDALKLFQETYLGKVKMIYIDPPYNTGNDFIYEDDFAEDKDTYFERSMQTDEKGNRLVANTESNGRFHSDWLSMMYPRVKLAKNLLCDDGLIFISVDDAEQSNLKRMCDEIFGESSFIAQCVRKRRDSQANLSKNISPIHEYVLIFSKQGGEVLNRVAPTIDEADWKNPDNDPRGPYVTMPCTNKGGAVYEVVTPSGVRITDEWRFKKETYDALAAGDKLVFPRGGDGKPRYKLFLSEKREKGVLANTWFDGIASNQEAGREIKELFDDQMVFDTPKPVGLLDYLLQLGSKPDCIVFDFFSGSASLADAIMRRNAFDSGNRQYILTQLPELTDPATEAYKAGYKTIAEIAKERIRRAGKKIKEEAGLMGADLDIGFRVLKVDTSNMEDVYYSPDAVTQDLLSDQVGNIKPDRTAEDLLFQVLLDWGVDLSLRIDRETIQGKEVFFVDENALAACFETGIDEDFVKELAKRQPLRAVFRDDGFASDAVKINVEQIFKLISPTTEVKSI
jgi:adenine-specific DNA-methyltransferase